jgi:hypothetical protein
VRWWQQNNTTRVRISGAVVHLKRRIVATGGINYVNMPVATDE